MKSFIQWLKNNKLAAVLLLVVVTLLLKNYIDSKTVSFNTDYGYAESRGFAAPSAEMGFMGEAKVMSDSFMPESVSNAPTDRIIIQDSYLSLVVDDVTQSADKVIETARRLGGFMVQRSLSDPAEGGTAHVTVRIPTGKLDEALQMYREMAVKVASENLDGTDVTDQYTDLEARRETLEKTKTKFEEILDSASEVQDILEVQRELISIQSQIDSIDGQKQYLEDVTLTSKITVYLSTDELSLPYTPSESWRPGVILKEAMRSLIITVRGIANLLIWLGVYAVIWVPVLLIIVFIKKRKRGGPKI